LKNALVAGTLVLLKPSIRVIVCFIN